MAKLEITEVKDTYSKAKQSSDLDIELNTGDAVEQEGVNFSVAIMPILDLDGDETTAGKTLAEQIATTFVSRGISVVERELLDAALSELALQQKKEFDPKSAQKVGKQLGAVAVVTGTITPKGNKGEAHVRLIRVQTGEAVVAASQSIGDVGGKVASAAPAKPSTGTNASNGKISPATLKKRFGGKAVLNAKTGELTLTYDFRNQGQLKDFDLSEAKAAIRGGMLLIGPTDSIKHIVPFESASVAGIASISNIENTVRPLVSAGSASLRYSRDGGLDSCTMRLFSNDREIAVSGGGEMARWANSAPGFRLAVAGRKITCAVSNKAFGGEGGEGAFGNLKFYGGSGGTAVGELVIAGIPKEGWLDEFLGK